MQDHERFLRNMLGLLEVFREPEMSEFRILAYKSALEPFTDKQIERAILEAARTKKFFPKPVELVELIQGNGEDKALTAWEQLQQAVSRAGAYQSVLFEDPKIARVIKILGGWETVCLWPMDEMQFRRHEFLQAYKGLSDNGPPEVLAGIHDRQNTAIGYGSAAPVVIGPIQARQRLPDVEKPPEMQDDGARIPIRDILKSLSGELFKPENGKDA